MAERDYSQSPIAEALGLKAVIDGLASDLQDLRNKDITPADALARAALAKQLFNGVRLLLVARGIRAPVTPSPEASPRVMLEGEVT